MTLLLTPLHPELSIEEYREMIHFQKYIVGFFFFIFAIMFTVSLAFIVMTVLMQQKSLSENKKAGK
tara:strand:- start:84 stop:281 length:198 start_codon:yes stop_codon:yes gene_type:complete